MSTFKFSVVVSFEITDDEAIEILADPQPSYALVSWLNKHCPCEEVTRWTDGYLDHNAKCLKEKLGQNRVETIIAERKQLAAPSVIEVTTE
jgi:hypothetical protein